MTTTSARIGYWSAFLAFLALILYTIALIAIFMTSPVFIWTSLPGYVAYVNSHNQAFKYLAQAAMLLFSLLVVVVMNVLHDYASAERKAFSRIALSFTILYAGLVSTHYFLQLTAVRLSLLRGVWEGLEQIVQGNPLSAVSAMNMLGWTLCLGLASFFAAPLFSGGRLERTLKVLFLLNGLFCVCGGIGYLFNLFVVILLTVMFGMGAALTAIMICLWVLFRRSAKPFAA